VAGLSCDKEDVRGEIRSVAADVDAATAPALAADAFIVVEGVDRLPDLDLHAEAGGGVGLRDAEAAVGEEACCCCCIVNTLTLLFILTQLLHHYFIQFDQ
jgi:hypothetical protein